MISAKKMFEKTKKVEKANHQEKINIQLEYITQEILNASRAGRYFVRVYPNNCHSVDFCREIIDEITNLGYELTIEEDGWLDKCYVIEWSKGDKNAW